MRWNILDCKNSWVICSGFYNDHLKYYEEFYLTDQIDFGIGVGITISSEKYGWRGDWNIATHFSRNEAIEVSESFASNINLYFFRV